MILNVGDRVRIRPGLEEGFYESETGFEIWVLPCPEDLCDVELVICSVDSRGGYRIEFDEGAFLRFPACGFVGHEADGRYLGVGDEEPESEENDEDFLEDDEDESFPSIFDEPNNSLKGGEL